MSNALRLGFVSVVRPLFKGDTHQAIRTSLEGLSQLAHEHDVELMDIHPVSDADRAMQAAEEIKEQELDLLLIQHTTFATGDLLAPLLTSHPRVGVWALPERAGGRGSNGPLPLNALCGLNMTLSFLDHPKVNKAEPVKWFYGEVDSDAFKMRLMTTLAALRGLKATQNARILQIGGTAPNFWGIEEHPFFETVQVDSLPLSAVFDRVASVSEDVAEKQARAWADEEVLEAPFTHLVQASKIEIILQELADEGNYNALALRCWPEFPEACGAMACSSVARLGDANLPAACEGDVMGALSMLVLQAMSNTPSILMDLSDHDPTDDGLLFWHCGNAAKDWAAHAGSRLTTHFNRDDTGVVRDMVLQPGEATGFRLLDGGQAAVILEGRFDNPNKPSYDGVRGWLYDLSWNGQAVKAQTAIGNILDKRLPHHLAFGKGNLTASLQEYCSWLGADVLAAHAYQDALYRPQKDVHV
jgi:L-fucose isomerase-like protein